MGEYGEVGLYCVLGSLKPVSNEAIKVMGMKMNKVTSAQSSNS
jgi:hypothetical protein